MDFSVLNKGKQKKTWEIEGKKRLLYFYTENLNREEQYIRSEKKKTSLCLNKEANQRKKNK